MSQYDKSNWTANVVLRCTIDIKFIDSVIKYSVLPNTVFGFERGLFSFYIKECVLRDRGDCKVFRCNIERIWHNRGKQI